MNVAYPYQFDHRGRTTTTGDDDHIRQMIEQVLFTSPGERVNRPTFGCGLMQLVFAPNSDALAAAMQMTAQAALQEWLGDLIQIESVAVEAQESTLFVEVRYIVIRTQARAASQFVRGLS